MSVILLLLAASLSMALIFLGAFIWSVRDRQFDDQYAPPYRILFDDKEGLPVKPEEGSTTLQNSK